MKKVKVMHYRYGLVTACEDHECDTLQDARTWLLENQDIPLGDYDYECLKRRGYIVIPMAEHYYLRVTVDCPVNDAVNRFCDRVDAVREKLGPNDLCAVVKAMVIRYYPDENRSLQIDLKDLVVALEDIQSISLWGVPSCCLGA